MLDPKNALWSYFLRSRQILKRRPPSLPKLSLGVTESIGQRTKSESNGYRFEQFIVSLFNSEYFTLLEWRSDKCFNGIYPLTCQFPDLELYFQSQSESLHFAVECKWRNYFERGSLEWAKPNQLENYKQFAKITSLPVFVILGVGGEANNPNEVYVIPLKDIDNTTLHCISLTPYRRKSPNDNLFLNCSKQILT